MSLMLEARKGVSSQVVKQLAEQENVSEEKLLRLIADGRVIVLEQGERVVGIGESLSTKVNANIGTSSDFPEVAPELAKLRAAEESGADTVMDLSTGGDLDANLSSIVSSSSVPVGTVPVYSAVVKARSKGKAFTEMSEDDFLGAVENHIKLGAQFLTVHCAILQEGARLSRSRVVRVVSRGGCFVDAWMRANKKENPYFTNYDYLLELCKEKDVCLSLGDALRPGALADADDDAMLHELRTQSGLVKRAIEAGVGTIVEGPGHMPMDTIVENVKLQKKLCHNVPYYVLGPLVTDVAPGYDHISGAIGGAIAAAAGVDFLCYVTPSEHLALPAEQDVRDGVYASRIAAHAADIVKRGDSKWDLEMSKARGKLDWDKQFDLALNPNRAKEVKKKRNSSSKACSMCGEYCAYKISSGE